MIGVNELAERPEALRPSRGHRPTVTLLVLVVLLFAGALWWAKGRDPFQRYWFAIKTPGYGKARCVAVLPKTARKPLPVVVYLQGADGNLFRAGRDLRQMAELGLAAVAIEYCQTNDAVFDHQFTALLRRLRQQDWADTHAVAWIGYHRGAEVAFRYAVDHPEMQPGLLIRLGSAWTPGLLPTNAATARSRAAVLTSSMLLVYAEHDLAAPVADVEKEVSLLRSNGVRVDLKLLAGQRSAFDPNREVIFRGLAEYCLTRLRGVQALHEYRSISLWEEASLPLVAYWVPAFVWMTAWLALRWRARRSHGRVGRAVATRSRLALRVLAVVLATLALMQTAIGLGLPRLSVNPTTLTMARRFLVHRKMTDDFDYLAANPIWRGQRLKVLLEHAALASYNRTLVNWELDDAIYREFVLSPLIAPDANHELSWRRPLWESFYPRIRNERSLGVAAEDVVRHLRGRVTVAVGDGFPHGVQSIWKRQITDPAGFERIYVAALRSAGIPARLNERDEAEYWNGADWKAAPRPALSVWASLAPEM